jgi:hypothetical protein
MWASPKNTTFGKDGRETGGVREIERIPEGKALSVARKARSPDFLMPRGGEGDHGTWVLPAV